MALATACFAAVAAASASHAGGHGHDASDIGWAGQFTKVSPPCMSTWPTLLTLLMFPILLVMYVHLAIKEEAEMRAQFGDVFERYAQRTRALCRTCLVRSPGLEGGVP